MFISPDRIQLDKLPLVFLIRLLTFSSGGHAAVQERFSTCPISGPLAVIFRFTLAPIVFYLFLQYLFSVQQSASPGSFFAVIFVTAGRCLLHSQSLQIAPVDFPLHNLYHRFTENWWKNGWCKCTEISGLIPEWVLSVVLYVLLLHSHLSYACSMMQTFFGIPHTLIVSFSLFFSGAKTFSKLIIAR